MDDVLIVGAGPAGSVAAAVLARAGVRVRLLDRAVFPRHKLCGDTINPGTLALLRRLDLAAPIEADALRVDGMVVTGEGGVAVQGAYPEGQYGVALSRHRLDAALLQQSINAGAAFECGVVVRGAILEGPSDAPVVRGIVSSVNGASQSRRAPIVIAADGRRSTIAFSLRRARHPARPKRWAVGAYFDDERTSSFGEMHIRRDRYIGVAPIGGGVSNVCVVRPWSGGQCDFRDPPGLLRAAIDAEPMLRARFAGKAPVRDPIMLGPLAVDVGGDEVPGLILAGDAAGFIDPMTGDGMRFAVRGGELAAAAALDALQQGWTGVHEKLAAARRREFAAKWRFNRVLRSLVAAPAAVSAAVVGARIAPAVVRWLVARAGDCDLIGDEAPALAPARS